MKFDKCRYDTPMDQPKPAQIRRKLLGWYVANRREMPWRAAPGALADPYQVLVSETMLQQTRVATVVEHFHRFMAAFPTVRALADAEEQHVLRLWQGLGYYRRARNLWRAARQIIERHEGEVPDDPAMLAALPGVGRYTAGAIASMAFGLPQPVVDGNVSRVLGRLIGVRFVDDPQIVRDHWQIMQRLVQVRSRDGLHAGDVNQAVMELGATVCTPKNVRCDHCPLRSHCVAARAGDGMAYGAKQTRVQPRSVTHRIVAVRKAHRWLFEQRPDTGLWSGMWQMPTIEEEAGATPDRWVLQRFGLQTRMVRSHGTFEHQTTHRRIQFELTEVKYIAGRLKRGMGMWKNLDAISDLPLGNAQQIAVRMLGQTDRDE